MDILHKEFSKYTKPLFFNFTRLVVYIITILILLGMSTRMGESQFVFVNFFIFLVLVLIAVIFDAINGIKKQKTYKSHLVKFLDNHILFVDHKGSFEIPYDEIKSFQFISSQIVIRITGYKFIISGRLHGINIEELKTMSEFLLSKDIISKTGQSYFYFFALFLLINFGSDYLFIDVLNMSPDVSLFGTLYICFAAGLGYFIWEHISAKKFLTKEDKYV